MGSAPKRSYAENLLDGRRVYHNPMRRIRWTVLSRHPRAFQSFYENGDWVYEQRDGQLLFRSVLTAISSEVRRRL